MTTKKNPSISDLQKLSLREKLGYPKWESKIDCSKEPSKTQQQFAEDCDINQIVAKYAQGNLFDPVNVMDPSNALYGDFSNIEDYHSMMTRLVGAQEAFEGLPIHLKKRFEQDPGKLIAFLNNPNNREEAERLGLVEKTPPPVQQQSEGKRDPVKNDLTGSASPTT